MGSARMCQGKSAPRSPGRSASRSQGKSARMCPSRSARVCPSSNAPPSTCARFASSQLMESNYWELVTENTMVHQIEQSVIRNETAYHFTASLFITYTYLYCYTKTY